MKWIGRSAVLVAVLGLMAGSAEAAKPAKGSKVTLKVVNKSDWNIHHMFVSPVDDEEWGPDQLGKNVIKAGGGEFTLTGIPCDTWDVKITDEEGDECVVESVDMCREDLIWTITSKDLVKCVGDDE